MSLYINIYRYTQFIIVMYFISFSSVVVQIMEAIDFDTLVVEVLSRLPAKSICQFKCVSKAWCAELSNVDNVICGKIEIGLRKRIYFPFDTPPLSLRFLSSLDGLLLVFMESCISKLILWNPTTSWYTILSDDYPKHGYNHQYDTGVIYYDQSKDLQVLHIKRRE
ncbi:putative F-box domain-containing protein [Helianthus anomalus]